MTWMTTLRALRTLAAVTALTLVGCEKSSTGDPTSAWQLVWSDEFDGTAGQLPDSTKWRFDVGTGWGNGQLEYDTKRRPENASLDGAGSLAITARQESWQGKAYTSARITTFGLFAPTGGRIEARLQMPRGQGLWPAFWLLGANQGDAGNLDLAGAVDTVAWPGCGEIDIMEYRGQEPSIVHGTVHGPGYSGAGGIGRPFELLQDRFDTGYHIFTLEWGADYINWLVDGMLYQTIRPSDVPGAWAFDHPFYIILNLAVGGGYVGAVGPTTTFPQAMLVDYVRVYQPAP